MPAMPAAVCPGGRLQARPPMPWVAGVGICWQSRTRSKARPYARMKDQSPVPSRVNVDDRATGDVNTGKMLVSTPKKGYITVKTSSSIIIVVLLSSCTQASPAVANADGLKQPVSSLRFILHRLHHTCAASERECCRLSPARDFVLLVLKLLGFTHVAVFRSAALADTVSLSGVQCIEGASDVFDVL
jgi:hypothetical protein